MWRGVSIKKNGELFSVEYPNSSSKFNKTNVWNTSNKIVKVTGKMYKKLSQRSESGDEVNRIQGWCESWASTRRKAKQALPRSFRLSLHRWIDWKRSKNCHLTGRKIGCTECINLCMVYVSRIKKLSKQEKKRRKQEKNTIFCFYLTY